MLCQYAITPNKRIFDSLVAALPAFTVDKDTWQHWGEQQLLACQLGKTAEVLPCGWVFNINNPASTACRAHMGPRTPEDCLRIYRNNCVRHGDQPVAKCEEVVKHSREHCQWSHPGAERDTRVVHFKGRQHKPWHIATGRCKRLRLGSLLIGPTTTSNGTAGLGTPTVSQHMSPITTLHEYAVEWSNEKQACLVTGGQRVVLWASGAPMQVKLCCTLFGTVAARWYGFAPAHWVLPQHGRGRETADVQRG